MNVNCLEGSKHFHTVSFDSKENIVILINQKKLPHQFSLVKTTDFYQTAAAIQDMTVRGAGAIGATAAFGFAQGCNSFKDNSLELFEKHWKKVFNTLAKARPTAVDPVNAMRNIIDKMKSGTSVESQQQIALEAAYQFAEDDIAHCVAIGQYGSPLIQDGMTLLTHCNAGALATSGWGTALGVIKEAYLEKKISHVYADEPRPRRLGARLTAFELVDFGIPSTLIPDSAAATLIRDGKIDAIIVGADRIAINGDTANKLGTFPLSVIAKTYRVPMYIAAPVSTIDFNTSDGKGIPIEERAKSEVIDPLDNGMLIAPDEIDVFNPSFDVTPHENITAIITEKGIIRPPFEENIKALKS